MSVEVKMGGVYEASIVKSGTSSQGAWKMIAIKEEGRGWKEITIWVDPTTPVEEGGSFRVDKITTVRFTARKDSRGEWRDACSVNAIISPSAPVNSDNGGGAPSHGSRFVNVDVGDEELPF